MAPKKTDPVADAEAAFDAAVAEVQAKRDDLITVEFKGHSYSFKRKRIDSTQILPALARNNFYQAGRFLLQDDQSAQFESDQADEEGVTDLVLWAAFYTAAQKAANTGN